jgi:CheY-like chemotaxis protein
MNKNNYATTEISDRVTKYETIMLIDDNPLDNFVNKSMVEKECFAKNILVHEKAASALEYLSNTEVANLPDLIFLDINMPEMNGFEFLDQFENLPERITEKSRIVMLSTSESFKDLNRANKNKFVRKFLNKPLTDQVLQAINI